MGWCEKFVSEAVTFNFCWGYGFVFLICGGWGAFIHIISGLKVIWLLRLGRGAIGRKIKILTPVSKLKAPLCRLDDFRS